MATQAQEILPLEDFQAAEVAPPKNPKHKLFADGFIAGKNATRAYIDAGYSATNAGVHAAALRKRPEIAAYIAAKQAQMTEESDYSAAKWAKELRGLAHSNIEDFTRLDEETGDRHVDFRNATREQLAAVSSIKTKKRKIYDNRGNLVGEEHQSEFRLWDKLRAAELLGRHARSSSGQRKRPPIRMDRGA